MKIFIMNIIIMIAYIILHKILPTDVVSFFFLKSNILLIVVKYLRCEILVTNWVRRDTIIFRRFYLFGIPVPYKEIDNNSEMARLQMY